MTPEQIEQYALENILDGVGIQSMIKTNLNNSEKYHNKIDKK
jgi:hypothetical protein